MVVVYGRRLKIAKKLLSDRGVIFISIDDNEQAQLKMLCDEILHNIDFVATIPWRKRTAEIGCTTLSITGL